MAGAAWGAVGFGLVALSQLAYFVGGLQFGGFGVGSVLTLACVLGALACAAGEARRERLWIGWGLGAFAAAQVLDYVTNLGALNLFFLGFTLFVAGVVLAALGAWRWNQEPEGEPRPGSVRLGAWLGAAAALVYILAGALGGGLNVFGAGASFAAIGWALVARTP
ncbi:MAG TPA: hypothetical protein VHH36_02315 [Candidatus Thermoplasmatota archaeon]|nr:hypothetical protein [Candidatus Thermoplasmatota archaeon]